MHSLIDTHCHLDFAAFDIDRDRVLNACQENHISDIVVPAISQATWQKTIELCQPPKPMNEHTTDPTNNQNTTETQLHLALGLHPMFIEQHEPQHLNTLDNLVNQYAPKAIGEIGLDFYLKNVNREKQRVFFSKQLIIAKHHCLPAIIHVRKAHDDCIKLLSEIGIAGGIIHNFSGSIQHAHKYIQLGFKLGFGGMLTFSRSRVMRKLAEKIPIESIVLETDAPDLTVEAHKGQRNSPEFLPLILQSLAEIKQRPPTEIARITSNNAKSVLKI